jgi:hypothetical protein
MATTGLPVLIAPVFSADRVARQMLYQKQDPRRIDQMSPTEITSGLILANLWGLRWTIFGALVMAPALAIGLLRLDVLDFSAWHESALSLGSATDAGQASWLLPDGSIPYLRLLLRAMSAVVIPILLTGLFVALGVTVALAVNDPGLSPLLSLLMALPGGGLILGIWTMLTRIPLLGGILEILRALLILGLFAGMGAGIHVLNQQAAKHLRAPLTHKAIPTDSPSTPDDSTP